MAKRLIPTGECWCGCRTRVDLGSFFAPGHDKRAESALIMNVFGGVPQFLNAFGYGPAGDDGRATASWVDNALRLAALPPNMAFLLEYPNAQQPAGAPLLTHEHVSFGGQFDLADGGVNLNVLHRGATSGITVPFVDLWAVYKKPNRWVIRVTGTLRETNVTPPGIEYVPLNHTVALPGAAIT